MADVKLVDKKDILIWNLKTNGRFMVSSLYKHITSVSDLDNGVFPLKSIWKANAPPRIAFFA